MKDGSKLFKDVDEETYAAVFATLQTMRRQHPGYGDDQLLMRILCTFFRYVATPPIASVAEGPLSKLDTEIACLLDSIEPGHYILVSELAMRGMLKQPEQEHPIELLARHVNDYRAGRESVEPEKQLTFREKLELAARARGYSFTPMVTNRDGVMICRPA